LLQFPELVVTQIVAIILISEFLDFRLFRDWDSKLSGMALPRLFSNDRAYRVAVVRNRSTAGIIGRLGRLSPKKHRRRSVQPIVDALRAGGHTVKVFEGDVSLLSELHDFLPPNPVTGQPAGIVFNLAHGIQGVARQTHVPAMLEMSGIAYTGATPLGHLLAVDKVLIRSLMQQAGVPTPAFCVLASPEENVDGLRYPLVVKPRHESNYRMRIAKNRRQLKEAVEDVVRRRGQQAVVEEYISGQEFNVALIGNDSIECLPLVEFEVGTKEMICPARIREDLAQRIRDYAKAAFVACDCRDYALINVRLGETGDPHVLEISCIEILERSGSFVTAAEQVDYTFADLMCRIVEVARARYLTNQTVRPLNPGVVSHPLADAILSRH
jgi:D-alanine-D-alanine ligase